MKSSQKKTIGKPSGWKSYMEGYKVFALLLKYEDFNRTFCFIISELLSRTTSIKEDLETLKNGSILWKVRNKGPLGLKVYRRVYRLNLDDLQITYTPHKNQSFGRYFSFGEGKSNFH